MRKQTGIHLTVQSCSPRTPLPLCSVGGCPKKKVSLLILALKQRDAEKSSRRVCSGGLADRRK